MIKDKARNKERHHNFQTASSRNTKSRQ